MNTDEQRLKQLLALARRGRASVQDVDAEDTAQALRPPPGFSTRLAARWAATRQGPSAWQLWERMAWCGSGVAGAACLLVVLLHERAVEPTSLELLLSATTSRGFF